MKIGRLLILITLLTIPILTACRDEPQLVTQVTFTPSPNPTLTPRPFATPTPDPLGNQRDAIIDALLTGTNPTQIINDLRTLGRPDAQYYYYLGLAYELSGDEQNAVVAYFTAWQDHCCDTWSFGPYGEPFTATNPYAIMAQAKLIPN